MDIDPKRYRNIIGDYAREDDDDNNHLHHLELNKRQAVV